MAMVMGADSLNPANTRLNNGYTLFDWAMRMKDIPAFWGRPLIGENRIEPEEIEFYREKKCKIALMVDDLTENEASSFDGTAAARRAVDRAGELGVPANEGIALFACIHEEWAVNHNWMMSYARVLRDNGYVPGFIGNTDSSKNFNFDRQCGHYVLATQDEGEYGAVYWATEPRLDGEPAEWAPFCPSDMTPEQMGLWRCGSIGVGDVAANTDYVRDATLLEYMW